MKPWVKKLIIAYIIAKGAITDGFCYYHRDKIADYCNSYFGKQETKQEQTIRKDEIQRIPIQKTLESAVEHYVTRVIDGDTLNLDDGRRIRLLGINASELRKKGVGKEFYADEAKQKLEELVRGEKVIIELDETDNNKKDKDKYERTLGYVIVNGQNTSIILLKDGYARKFMHERLKYRAEIEKTEQEAREARKGIWAKE